MTDFGKPAGVVYGPRDPKVKWEFLKDLGIKHGLDTLVETGGYHGGTMEYLQVYFRRLATIELGDLLFDDIYKREIPNAVCLRGDSARVLKTFLLFVDGPALFWLDAHCSGGDTTGTGEIPAYKELKAVLDRGCKGDVIAIDDMVSTVQNHLVEEVVSQFSDRKLEYVDVSPGVVAVITGM